MSNFELEDEQNPFASDDIGDTYVPPSKGSRPSKASAEAKAAAAELKRQTLENMTSLLSQINDKDLPYQSRIESLQLLTTTLVPTLFQELLSEAPNVERSIVASRALMAIKASSDLMTRKREAEISDELNPYSPKFQLAFGWIVETFYNVLQNQGLEDLQVNSIFNDLAVSLTGLEDKLEKRLKGVASKALAQLENPFVADFKAELKERTKAAGVLDGSGAPEGIPLN